MDDVTKEEIIKEAIENAKKENKKSKHNAHRRQAQKNASREPEEKPETNEEEDKPEDQEAAQAKEPAGESTEDGSGESKEAGGQADPKQEKINELEDKVKRQLAEFENFRNRTEKEKSQMYDMGAKSVLEKILPVIDNFERGLATVPAEDAGGAFAEGMNMIYKQLLSELEKIGVTPIEAVGKEFDPNLHNAVMQVESDTYESGIVAQEMQKGYMYHDTVLRHSMVGVVA